MPGKPGLKWLAISDEQLLNGMLSMIKATVHHRKNIFMAINYIVFVQLPE